MDIDLSKLPQEEENLCLWLSVAEREKDLSKQPVNANNKKTASFSWQFLYSMRSIVQYPLPLV